MAVFIRIFPDEVTQSAFFAGNYGYVHFVDLRSTSRTGTVTTAGDYVFKSYGLTNQVGGSGEDGSLAIQVIVGFAPETSLETGDQCLQVECVIGTGGFGIIRTAYRSIHNRSCRCSRKNIDLHSGPCITDATRNCVSGLSVVSSFFLWEERS